MTLVVSPESVLGVKIFLKDGRVVEGDSIIELADYTAETTDGEILDLGRCFKLGDRIFKSSDVKKIVAFQTVVREVIIYRSRPVVIREVENEEMVEDGNECETENDA